VASVACCAAVPRSGTAPLRVTGRTVTAMPLTGDDGRVGWREADGRAGGLAMAVPLLTDTDSIAELSAVGQTDLLFRKRLEWLGVAPAMRPVRRYADGCRTEVASKNRTGV
jgi:hypothetical protein